MISKQKKEEIEGYLSRDLDALLVSLAETEYALGFKFSSMEIKPENGEEVLNSLENKLFNIICVKWRFCEKKDNPRYNDTVNLISAIADIIAALTIKVTPTLLAVILFKKGLSKFCKCPK